MPMKRPKRSLAANVSALANAAPSRTRVAEWLYLDWASRAPQPLPNNFVHAEWITLHDNSNFRGFVAHLARCGAFRRSSPV